MVESAPLQENTVVPDTSVTTQKTVTTPIAKEPFKSKFNTNLERFQYICKDLPSPNLFIDFNFYFMIAACLNRKVWIGDEGDLFRLYPNLFLIFVADPGVGKSMPASASHFLLDTLTETRLDKKTNKYIITKLLYLGPDAVTFEKLVLRAHNSSEVIVGANGKNYYHSSTTFCLADEMGMLFNDMANRVILFLNKAWDCRDYQGDTIKHGEIIIKNPCASFLGCAPPESIHEFMRNKTFTEGFTARTMFIYANKKRHTKTIIRNTADQREEGKVIQNHLRKLATLPPTQITYTPEAFAWLDEWTQKRLNKNVNTHPKMRDFNGRRQAHLIKLAMNRHYFEKLTPVIEVEDFVGAEIDLNKVEMESHLALSGSGENPAFKVAELIKKYLIKHGPTTKQKLLLQFYSELETEKIQDVFDFLIGTEQCNATTVNHKPALALSDKKENYEDDPTSD